MENVQNYTNSQSENNNNDNSNNNQNVFQKIWNAIVNVFQLIGKAIAAFWNTLTKKTPNEKFMIDMYKQMSPDQLKQQRQLIKQRLMELDKQQTTSEYYTLEFSGVSGFGSAMADAVAGGVGAAQNFGNTDNTENVFRKLQTDVQSGAYTKGEIARRTARNALKTYGMDAAGASIGAALAHGMMAKGSVLLASLGLSVAGPAGVVVGIIAEGVLHFGFQKLLELLFEEVVPYSETKTYVKLPAINNIIKGGDNLLKESELFRTIAFESNHHPKEKLKQLETELTKSIAFDQSGAGMLEALKNFTNFIKNYTGFKEDENEPNANKSMAILNDQNTMKVYADCLTFEMDSSTPSNDKMMQNMMASLKKSYTMMNDMVISAKNAMNQQKNEFNYKGKDYVINTALLNFVDKVQHGDKEKGNDISVKLMRFGQRCLEYMNNLKFVQDIGSFWSSLYGALAREGSVDVSEIKKIILKN